MYFTRYGNFSKETKEKEEQEEAWPREVQQVQQKKKMQKTERRSVCEQATFHVLEKNIERDNSYPEPFINQSNEPIPNRFINSSSDTKLFATLLKTQYAGLKVDKRLL